MRRRIFSNVCLTMSKEDEQEVRFVKIFPEKSVEESDGTLDQLKYSEIFAFADLGQSEEESDGPLEQDKPKDRN
ncbi:hypothetical protein C5167_040218 [Papaver somniferum]|uniref:Uncharacterized protein n=1 Tax=Papaver somniferum TaxID=3469 RepID=A0A4Y7IEC4_PAPSO|nr:hypothetical protein C5167_040218 [Papaver somniferum]